MINVSDIGHDVELLTGDGSRYRLNDVLLSLQLEEQAGQLAQRATLTMANADTGDASLMEKAKLNCVIRIHGKLNGGTHLLFEGPIWEWGYDSSTRNEVTVTAYDNLIRLQQSRDFKYYPAGMATQAIIGDICNDWGIPLAYKWDKGITHGKKTFNGATISEMIRSLLDEVRQRTGAKYVAHYRDGQLQIVGYGSNGTVYRFDAGNTVSTTNRLNLNNLVTRVKVIGKEDGDGRAPVDAVVDGDLGLGVLQEIVRRDSDKNLTDAQNDATMILKERGKPDETIQVNVPDVPVLRKGDAVEMAAGNLGGVLYVEGVSHNATARQMILTLTRIAWEEAGEGSRPLLKKGDRGQDVSDMQTLLIQKGQTLPIFGVDGIFGNETEKAVKGFQGSAGLSADGICGPKTWAALGG